LPEDVAVPKRDDVPATKRKLYELADNDALIGRRDSLLELAGAIDGEDAHYWAKLNLFDVFGEDAVSVPKEKRHNTLATVIDYARNICILFPLLITWLGIAFAMSAYGDLLDANPDAGAQPFVQLWQSGFEGRTSSFSTIGRLDVFAILMVILLSLASGAYRYSLDVKIRNVELDVWNQLREVLTSVSLQLAKRAFDTPARFNEELTKASAGLERITSQIRNASSDAVKVVERVVLASERIEGSLTAYTEAAKSQDASANRLEVMVGMLPGHLEQLESSEKSTVLALAGISADIISLGQQVQKGLDVSGAALIQIAEVAHQLGAATQSQVAAADRFLAQSEGERERTATMAALAEAMAQQFEIATSGLGDLAVRLDVTVESLGVVTAAMPAQAAEAYLAVIEQVRLLASEFDSVTTTAVEGVNQGLAGNVRANGALQASMSSLGDRVEAVSVSLVAVESKIPEVIQSSQEHFVENVSVLVERAGSLVTRLDQSNQTMANQSAATQALATEVAKSVEQQLVAAHASLRDASVESHATMDQGVKALVDFLPRIDALVRQIELLTTLLSANSASEPLVPLVGRPLASGA